MSKNKFSHKTRQILVLITLLFLSIPFFGQNSQKADSLIEVLKTTNDTTKKVSILKQLCWKFRNNNPDTAVYFGEKAIELSKGSKNARDIIDAFGFTGVAYRNKGVFDKALELYYKGAGLAELYKEYEALTYAYINIANILIYRNDQEGALNFLNKANRSSILVDNDLQKSYIFLNLGRVYTNLENFEKAHYFIGKALDLRISLKDQARIAVVLKYNGDLLFAEKKQNEAILKYHEALKIAERINEDKDLISDTYQKLSQIYLNQSNFSEAERYAAKSLEISQEIGAKYRIKDACYSLAGIYAFQRKYKRAYKYYVLYAQTKDSIFSAESNRQISNLQTEYEIEKQQKENEILKARQARDKEIIRKREIIILSGTIGLFLLLIIIFILWTSIKAKKTANVLLTQKNNKIAQIAKELDKANKTKVRFFSIIAHDLKNPFNVIIGFSNLLKTNINDFDKEKIQLFAGRINETSQNAYSLLENLLEWSKSQTNSIAYNPVKVKINSIIEENTMLLKNHGIKKNTIISNEINKDYYILADFNMISTVVRNLISNAVKFTENGTISISAKADEKNCEICIADTGVGISTENVDKLFKIENSISTIGTDGEQGTGIGLILCKEFVTKNGGKIWVESEKEKGSKFFFTVPLA